MSSKTFHPGAVSALPDRMKQQQARRHAKKQRYRENRKSRAENAAKTTTTSTLSNESTSTLGHRDIATTSDLPDSKEALKQKLLHRLSDLQKTRRGNPDYTSCSRKTDESLQRMAADALGLDSTSQESIMKSLRSKNPTMYDSIVKIIQSNDAESLIQSLTQQINKESNVTTDDIAPPDGFF
jgi:hypothetical protein